jgi:ribosomal-protein-alanine N-acetyltransferase
MADKKPNYPTPPSLVGEKLYLRATTSEDVVNTHHWFLQSEPQSLSEWPAVIMTAAEASEAFKRTEKSQGRQEFTIVRREDNMPVGRILFRRLNAFNRSVELQIMIDPEERRKKHALNAIKILGKYLFSTRGMNKLYMQMSAENSFGIKLVESLGFRRDATLRHHYFINGEFYDGYIYSVLLFECDW